MKILFKKTGKLFIVSLLMMLAIAGCKDFLAEDNKSNLTQKNYFTSPKQAKAAVAGIYTQLRSFTQGMGYGEAPWVSMELLVGYANTNGQSSANRKLINHSAGTKNPVFNVIWDSFYNGIANANLAIARIPGVEMEKKEKKKLLGEAHFLRALYYYYLVRLYGSIPLITKPVDASSKKLYPEQVSAEKIYELIVSDLKFAENAGLPNQSDKGRASVGAVKSLMASVYLTMAGYPLQAGDKYYKLAAQKAEEVIDSGWYHLFEDYSYLHDRKHENLGEFIFSVQYEAGIATNGITQLITPEQEGITGWGDEYGSLRPIDEFVASYEKGDLRVEEKEFYFTQYTVNGETQHFGEYALWKYWLEAAANPATGDLQNDMNWTLLRLPEIMLIYAEATNELRGPTAKAYKMVNKIRARANLEPLSGLSKDAFREAIWRERYHELAYESKAYFDIQRTHKVYNLKTGHFVDAFNFENIKGVTWSKQYMLWPIPQDEMQANKKLEQNPGWGE